MKIKTCDLIGPALDWAVAKVEGCSEQRLNDIPMWKHIRDQGAFRFSTDWSAGGPIIDRVGISIQKFDGSGPIERLWNAYTDSPPMTMAEEICGPTPLVAAMRCHVTNELGTEVEVPDELNPNG